MNDLRGIGFDPNSDENIEKGVDKWIKSTKPEPTGLITSPNPNDSSIYHEYDRDVDLEDIKKYYSEYYDLIVKPIVEVNEDTTDVNDLLEKYTKKIEFVTHSTDEKKDKECGRREIKYTFTPELLSKFKIKSQATITNDDVSEAQTSDKKGSDDEEFHVPFQLFVKIFGKE